MGNALGFFQWFIIVPKIIFKPRPLVTQVAKVTSKSHFQTLTAVVISSPGFKGVGHYGDWITSFLLE